MKSFWISLCFFALASAAPRPYGGTGADEYHPQPAPLYDYIDFPGEKVDWFGLAQDRLRAGLARDPNMLTAKNVILFVGDGMGVSTVTAARIYNAQTHGKKGEEAMLAWEKLPHTALSITNNVDYQVPDSAGTATAMLTGVKNNYYTVGVTEEVKFQNCSVIKDNKLKSALHYAKDEGKWTGIVTTTRITHATPAAAYSSSPDRGWESSVGETAIDGDLCTDIALQLIEDPANQDIRVILGGGRAHFLPEDMEDLEPEEFPRNGSRLDGEDLIERWKEIKEESELAADKYKFVKNFDEFDSVKTDEIEYLFGMFNPDHLDYEIHRLEREEPREPSLVEMVETTIKILQRSDKGFFLLVEGGRIDHAHHDNIAHRSLNETVVMSNAVEKALEMTDEKDTLIIVTADHSHVFTMGGYNSINNDILGLSDDVYGASDNKPFTTLSYGNGPGFFAHRGNVHENETEHPRMDLTGQDTTAEDYQQDAPVPMMWESHGGEEVAIYASGPMSHLLTGVVEQNYIAHVMMYASCIGKNKEHCELPVRYPSCPMTDAASPRYTFSALVAVVAMTQFVTWMGVN